MRVLVTRPAEEGVRTAGRLAALGHDAHMAPVTQIVGTGLELPDSDFDGLIATSARALHHARLTADLLLLPIHVVGEKTAALARDIGFGDVRVVGRDALDLLDKLLPVLRPESHLLYLAGRERRGDLERLLRQECHQIDVAEVYAAEAVAQLPDATIAALAAGRIDAALHYSPRAASILIALADAAGVARSLEPLRHICISEAAAVPLRGLARDLRIAATPDEPAMLAALAP